MRSTISVLVRSVQISDSSVGLPAVCSTRTLRKSSSILGSSSIFRFRPPPDEPLLLQQAGSRRIPLAILSPGSLPERRQYGNDGNGGHPSSDRHLRHGSPPICLPE